MSQTQVTAETLGSLCGEIGDWKVTAILGVGGRLADLEDAVAWSAGDGENTPRVIQTRRVRPLRIYEILIAGEEEDDCL